MTSSATDTYTWASQTGGSWATASNWLDTTTGVVATGAPGAASTVAITGGTADNFVNVGGSGAAAQLTLTQEVLLWGTTTVTGTVALLAATAPTELDLDGGVLVAGGVTLAAGTALELADNSSLTATAAATLTDGFLLAASGSAMQLGGLIANSVTASWTTLSSTIAVDDSGSIEIGTAGGAAAGVITVDAAHTAALSGTIYGNVVVNGTVAVEAGNQLSIDLTDPFGNAQSISGIGSLSLSESSQLTLGVADSANIQFAGPSGTLVLAALPSGTIRGFAAGDIMELKGLATGLRYTQTSTSIASLTLTRGTQSVGILTLAGNYAGDLFHVRLDAAGNAFISLQMFTAPPAQPTLLNGTTGSDILTATANGQTLTGYGGNDTLNAGSFTAIDFKDSSADLNGSTLASFTVSDLIDLTDIKPSTATVTFTPAIYSSGAPVPASLMVTDGTHTVTLGITGAVLPSGYWTTTADGAGGTDVKFAAVNMDAYSFAPPTGDSYGAAANWKDATTATTASTAPGYGNGVTIAGGTSYTDVAGTGVAASLSATGDVLLLGNLNVGSVIGGVSGVLTQTGTLVLDSGANLTLAGSAAIGGILQVGGGSRLTGAGPLTFTSPNASLLATGLSAIQFGSILTGGSVGSSLYTPANIAVDASASVEFGTAGTAKLGALTIDSGITAVLGGTISAAVVLKGTLEVSARSLAVNAFPGVTASVTGTGVLEIDSGGTLALAGSDSTAIQFTQTGGTLALANTLPTATIGGYTMGDVITLGRMVTSLGYSQTGANSGTLTLYNGMSTLGTLSLAGSYSAQQFQVQVSASNGSSSITLSPSPGTAAGYQVSSGNDAYAWAYPSGGVWSNASNWTDTTTGSLAVTAPGAGDAVVIQDNTGANSPQIISGSGTAASLSVYAPASTVFTGTITVGGLFYVADGTTAGVSLAAGASFSVGALREYANLAVTGGSALTVTGTAGGTSVSGGSLTLSGGSTVRLSGSLDLGGGTIGVDATSALEFGSAGNAAAGSVTIDQGQEATMEENAIIAAKLVVNGILDVNNGTIEGVGGTAGSITGGGTIQIGTNFQPAKLVLYSSDSAAIVFYPYSSAANFTGTDSLEIRGPLPTGLIAGFTTGDTIQLDRTVTGASFVQTTATQGVLTLTNGAATVGTLAMVGNYAASQFQLDVAAATGIATISLLPATIVSGTAAANIGTDSYSWTGASGGDWNTAANWTDTTTGTMPSTVPGAGNAVSITGTQAIGGSGAAASLATNGKVVLTGQVNVTGQVAVGAPAGQSGSLALAGARLNAASVLITGGLQVETAGTATISGATTLAAGTLMALGGSTIQLGSLLGSGGGNVVAVDANSVIKIGTSASTTAGTVNIAAGAAAALTGSIYGNVLTNGTVAVAGGGTLFIDMTGSAGSDPYLATPSISGSGALSIAENGTLGLGAVNSATIQFAGPGGTLVLAVLPTATITGFGASDQIQIEKAVTGVSYTQLTASTAALTLTNGSSFVGILTLGGSFNINTTKFHVDSAPNGAMATITLQTLGIAASQPGLIQGTKAADTLTATANFQTLTGAGGGDTLNGAGFSLLDFKDTTANLNGCTIQNFTASDLLDFTDMTAAAASVRYSAGVLSVTDGTHTASLHLAFVIPPTSGSFSVTSDGASGSKVIF